MLESIVLDILLVLVIFLMMAIGAYRGGMREAFSAAGLLLGVLVVTEWVDTWGGWLARNTSLSDGGGRFLAAVATMLLVTMAVGYGVGSSFNYHPAPGGRLFGMMIAVGSALVAISYVLTWLRLFLFDGEDPKVVGDTVIARFLDGNAGLVMLVVSGAILAAGLFSSFVRERDDGQVVDAASGQTMASPVRRQHAGINSSFPEKVEPAERESRHRTAPVRIMESQQWEDRTGSLPSRKDRMWSNTWPSDAPGVPPERHVRPTSDVRQARERRQQGNDGAAGGETDGSSRQERQRN